MMEGSADRKEARRPMNSFFIFCKRHRSMVQSKHPNLDNRSISRILGDLWANLDKGEKQQYKVTAKQYKDAFMKANPGYKWHSYDKSTLLLNPANFRDSQSIPAPKTADPSNNAYKTLNKDCLTCYQSCPSNGNNMNLLMMAIDENATASCCHLPQSEIKEEYSGIPADSSNMSKLHAKISWLSKINLKPDPDIAELRLYQNWYCEHKGVPANLYGSLSGCSDQQYPVKKSSSSSSSSSPPPPPLPSSQITVATTTTTAATTTITTTAAAAAPPSTTTTVLQSATTPPPLPPLQQAKDSNESDECKSHPSDGSVDADVAALLDCPLTIECPLKDSGIPTRKSKRRNKGAIYKNLIASGALPASRERLAEIQATYKVTSDDCNMYNYHQHRQQQPHQSHEQQSGRKLQRTMSESDSHQDKRYKTGDFDLEAKIATLPACSMESVGRSRKNSGKQKTGSESSRQTSTSCTTDTLKSGMLIAPPHRRRPCIYPPIVGSRKRKQPRDGIMRILPLSKEYKHPLANVMKIPLATFFIHPSMKSYQHLQLNSKPDGQDPVTSDSTSEEGKGDESSVVASAAGASVKTGDRNSAALSQTLTVDTNCNTQSEPEAGGESFQPRITQECQHSTSASEAPPTTATCSETEAGGGLAASQSQQPIHRVNPTPLHTECNNFSDHNSSNNSSPSITCNNNNNNNNDNNLITNNNSNNNNDGENVKGSSTTTTTNFTNTTISTKNNNNNSYNITFNNNDNINTTTTTTINNTNNNNNHHHNHNNDISKSSATCVDTNTCTGDNMGKPSCPTSVEVKPNLHVTGELKITTLEDPPQKHAKLSENPDFKIWISNLAEAAERSGQIPVC